MLAFVLSLVSSGSQNVYHCSRNHTHTWQSWETESEKGAPLPHYMSLLKNKQRAFPEVARSLLMSHWPEICHMSMLNQSLGCGMRIPWSWAGGYFPWRIWLLRHKNQGTLSLEKRQSVDNKCLHRSQFAFQYLDGIAQMSVCLFIYSPKLFCFALMCFYSLS